MKHKPFLALELAAALAFLLFTAYPLWAKCITASVEVRAKIDCSFKPDDEVLATLIFFDPQAEASAEENAIDIHDGTFKGRVAFDTYSSSSFWKGDRCHRSPKGITTHRSRRH